MTGIMRHAGHNLEAPFSARKKQRGAASKGACAGKIPDLPRFYSRADQHAVFI